ncbi:hypothetical protein LSTR_LSTR012848 [Laodelphax striatellus]|uniref:ATP-dependent DNA helicase n=1 Tax=Laodelphax striatellus TaxID=195883 RepID=A0A482XPG3_LAOST|nr:hypothetical protein LSTR_LSTR012848 [Laodelphax striatellus]
MWRARFENVWLTQPNRVLHHENMATEEMREKNYSLEELKDFLQKNEGKMIPDQKHVFDTILQAILSDQGGMFFLDAPGGTGKNFLINLILAKIQEKGEIALAVASSGIAATLLSGGRTAHSAFKLPLNMTLVDRPTCHIPRQSGTAKLLQKCKLIVWDECTCLIKLHLKLSMNTARHQS